MAKTVTTNRKLNYQRAIICLTLAAIFLITMIISAKTPTQQIPPGQTVYNLSSLTNLSNIDINDWRLKLVNSENPLSENYSCVFTQLANGSLVDERCYPELQEMLDDCRAEGLSPVICSAYRSRERQQDLFQKKVNDYLNIGYSDFQAEFEAAQVVARPGYSEHQLGLAMDIVDLNNQILDESQEQTAVQQWLMEHSWEYGFIMRYPPDKSEFTGIIYEPWHYRYVGREAAQIIYEQNFCLEEFIALLKTNV